MHSLQIGYLVWTLVEMVECNDMLKSLLGGCLTNVHQKACLLFGQRHIVAALQIVVHNGSADVVARVLRQSHQRDNKLAD